MRSRLLSRALFVLRAWQRDCKKTGNMPRQKVLYHGTTQDDGGYARWIIAQKALGSFEGLCKGVMGPGGARLHSVPLDQPETNCAGCECTHS